MLFLHTTLVRPGARTAQGVSLVLQPLAERHRSSDRDNVPANRLGLLRLWEVLAIRSLGSDPSRSRQRRHRIWFPERGPSMGWDPLAQGRNFGRVLERYSDSSLPSRRRIYPCLRRPPQPPNGMRLVERSAIGVLALRLRRHYSQQPPAPRF
jgi:hypothetical protein